MATNVSVWNRILAYISAALVVVGTFVKNPAKQKVVSGIETGLGDASGLVDGQTSVKTTQG